MNDVKMLIPSIFSDSDEDGNSGTSSLSQLTNRPSHPRKERTERLPRPATAGEPVSSNHLNDLIPSERDALRGGPKTNSLSLADQNQKKIEKGRRKAEKEALLREKRQQRIRHAFESHAASASGRRDSIEIIVSPGMFQDRSRHDVLKVLRVSFPEQIVTDSRNNINLIKWRRILRKPLPPSEYTLSQSDSLPLSQSQVASQSQIADGVLVIPTEEVSVCLFIFRAAHYLMHLDRNTLDECAKSVKTDLNGQRIIFAVCGMDLEVRRRMRIDARTNSDSFIVDKKAVQDSYVHLYMEHGIRTHDARDLDELAHYISNLTEAIASAPFVREQDVVTASLALRRKRAGAGYRTTVTSEPGTTQEGNGVGLDSDSEEENVWGYNAQKKVSLVRVEGERDIGHLYLAMLCLIPGVTLTKAQCIRERFPTLRTLLDMYDDCSSEEQKVLLLSELRYGATNRRIGPSLSRCIAKVLTSIEGDVAV